MAIFVFDGVEELDAVGVYEVLGAAKHLHPPLDLTVRFRALKEQITGALGMKFLAHEVRRDPQAGRPLLIPRGSGPNEGVQGSEGLHRLGGVWAPQPPAPRPPRSPCLLAP